MWLKTSHCDATRSFVSLLQHFLSCLKVLFFFLSLRSRLSIRVCLPHVIEQALTLQSSLKAEGISSRSQNLRAELEKEPSYAWAKLVFYEFFLLTVALCKIQTLTSCNFTIFFEDGTNILDITSQMNTLVPICFTCHLNLSSLERLGVAPAALK